MRAICVRALTVALLTVALAPFEGAAAQDFPSRPVRFVVPYAAGGSGDLLARLLGNKLASIWGQQVVVDNRPGAGGLIGTESAARSEPDGYTLYLATDGPLTIAATLYKRVPYDWKRDFAPVSLFAARGDFAVRFVIHNNPSAVFLERQIDDAFDHAAAPQHARDRRFPAARAARGSRPGPRDQIV